MKKVFFQNLTFLIILNLLIKPLWVLGVDRSVQNMVGHENYGLYFALFSFSFLFSIILDVGITNYNSQIIAQQPTLIKKHFTNILSIKLLLAAVYLVVTIIASFAFHLVNTEGFVLLLVLCFNQVLSSVILYIRSNISALHYFKTDSVLSVLDKLLMIIFFAAIIYLIPYKGNFRIEWFVYAQTVSYAVTVVVACIILLTLIPRPSFEINFSRIKKIWKESYPFAVLVLLMTVYYKIDSVMLKQLLGNDGNREAGIYASAFRLMDAANQFGYLFAALLLPIFSRMLVKHKPVGDLLLTSFKTIFIFSLLPAVICLVFRNEIMQLLYTEHSAYSAMTLGIIMFALIGSSTQYIFGTLLTANRNLKQLNTIALIAVLLNISLNYFLIPQYRCLGAAAVCLLTQTFVAVSQMAVSGKIFSLRMNLKFVFRIMLFSIIVTAISFGTKYFPSDWKLQIIIAAVLGLFTAFILRIFELKKVLALVKSSDE